MFWDYDLEILHTDAVALFPHMSGGLDNPLL